MSESKASVHEANKLLRVLNGGSPRLKYTVRVHRPDGTVFEFQQDKQVRVTWNDALRQPWLVSAEYQGQEIMAWPEGSVLLVEQNPEAEK